jgi:hypothetical protein
MTELPQRKNWDGRRAAPYAGPDPFELSRRRAEEEDAKRRAEEHVEQSSRGGAV